MFVLEKAKPRETQSPAFNTARSGQSPDILAAREIMEFHEELSDPLRTCLAKSDQTKGGNLWKPLVLLASPTGFEPVLPP